MPELEFTGERVIPGLVETNLFNEHFARYRFAARFTAGRVVLDAGCGSGYGSALFTEAQRIVAIDFSAAAVQHARAHYSIPQSRHAQARCEALPFAAATFDLIAAFEVIEHLYDWQALLTEARRVLRPDGLLLVSTPNKAYYAESRAAAGPNPFHTHEFEYDEFRAALQAVFPNVALWCQNHADGIVFAAGSSKGDLVVEAPGNPETAHFYLAVCTAGTLPASTDFAWMPESANVLQARERHIGLLKTEVAKKSEWLHALEIEHGNLQTEHETVVAELERANNWAAGLNGQLAETKQWGKGLEAEITRGRAVIAARDLELAAREIWIAKVKADLADRDASISAWQSSNERLNRELLAAHAQYQERLAASEADAIATNAQWAAETARLEAETQAVHKTCQAVIAIRANEAAADLAIVQTGYEGKIAELETESAGIAAGYQAMLARRDTEAHAIHVAYRNVIASFEARISELHIGYQASYQSLEAEIAGIHPTYQAAIRQLEFESGQRLQLAESLDLQLTAASEKLEAEVALRKTAANSKWLRLGQALHLGPKLDPGIAE